MENGNLILENEKLKVDNEKWKMNNEKRKTIKIITKGNKKTIFLSNPFAK
jgi:hypothetical protein